MTSIAYVDPDFRGHAPLYAKTIIADMNRRGVRVHHLSNDPMRARAVLGAAGLDVRCHRSEIARSDSAGGGQATRQCWDRLGNDLRRLRQSQSIDATFIAWLDPLMHRSMTAAEVPHDFGRWSGLWVNAGSFSCPRKGWWRSRKEQRCVGVLRHPGMMSLATFDEIAIPRLQNVLPDLRIDRMPDFIETAPPNPVCPPSATGTVPPTLAKRLGDASPVLLSLGVIHRRKGVLALLQTAMARRLSGWSVMVAGKVRRDDFGDAELALFERAVAGRIPGVVMDDQYVPDASLEAVVRRSDAVYLGYEDWRQSSNIMTRAARVGRPVISPAKGLLADRTRRFDLGWQLKSNDVDAIAASLSSLSRDRLDRQCRHAQFGEYAAFQSTRHLSGVIDAAVAGAGVSDAGVSDAGVARAGVSRSRRIAA